jgi:hypothetical protein
MEMAFGIQTGLTLLVASTLSAFPVTHKHLRGRCAGDLQIDTTGVSFTGSTKHAGHWKLEDVRQLELAPDHVFLLTYKGAFDFRGDVPARQLYATLKDVMDQRLVMESAQPEGLPAIFSVPVKHRGGADGTLSFSGDAIVFASDARDESRTWRYKDIDNIATSGPFQLTVTTFERALMHYSDRRDFNFELKQPITDAKYNEIWLLVEKKNGRIP